MAEFLAKNIRNVVLVGHGGEGKTTLAEAILYNAKAIDRQGRTEDGNTVMDFDSEEIAKKISISLSMANCVYDCEFGSAKINLIDTPGFFDFEGEMRLALDAADGAIVVSGLGGSVSVGTEKAVDYCIKNNIPTILFLNGTDKENADYIGTMRALKEKYTTKIAPMQIPIMQNEKMTGYVNVLNGKAFMFGDTKTQIEIPDNLKEEYEELKLKLVESAAESDEAMLEKYFAGETFTTEEIIYGVKKGVLNGSCIPVLAGSAVCNKGVFNLMNEIVSLLPSPADSKTVAAKDKNGKVVEIACEEKAPTVVKIFKTVADPFVGRLSMFKVLSGVLKVGTSLKNVNKNIDEKIGALYFVSGKKQESTNVAHAGDMGAIAKLQNTSTGDTLCDASMQVTLPNVELPKPVLTMAVYAAKKGDEDKVFSGLYRLQDEDNSFTVTKNTETGEMLLNGIGETQLDLLCKKLKNKFGVEAVLREPRIAYRETIKKAVEAEGKHKKQSGGAGQFGQCVIKFSPYAEGEFLFVDSIVGASIPNQFIPAVEKGLLEALPHGVLAGYPMVNIRAELVDGKYHPVDSKEIAFKIAASLAYKDGCSRANPTILEPIYTMKISVPDSYLGDIFGDMNKRRGRILGAENHDGRQIISAEAPLSEIMKYATDLRSMTQGRGSYELEFARYEEVPPQQIPKIVEDAKKWADKE